MKKKRISMVVCIVLSVLLIAVFFAGCGSKSGSTGPSSVAPAASPTTQKYEWSAATAVAEDTVNGLILKKFKELTEQKSGGKIKINLFLGGQLGSDREMHEGLAGGTINFVSSTTSMLSLVVPQAGVFDMAYVFPSVEVARKVLKGPFKDKLNSFAEAKSVHILGFSDLGFRIITANRPVNKLEDFKGLKVRVMENKNMMAFIKSIGANPTPMDLADVFLSLQQGTIDAQSNAVELTVAQKFFEVQKCLINTKHELHIITFLINDKLYKNLPADMKSLVDGCAEEAIAYGNEQSDLRIGKKLQVIKDARLTIIDLPNAEIAKIKEKVLPIYDNIRKDLGSDIVDSLVNEIKNNSAVK